MRRGNCYVATEALFHILGGYNQFDWRPHRLKLACGETHWFLRHTKTWDVLDPTRCQFIPGTYIPYCTGQQAGFLTRYPSKRALKLIEEMTWQEPTGKRSRMSRDGSTREKTSRSR